MQKTKKHIGIIYNAPVTLTFALLCVVELILQNKVFKGIPLWFIAPCRPGYHYALNFAAPLQYVRLFLHVFAHSDIEHLMSNLSFLLLLGPGLEERFGGPVLALMMLATAFATAVVNACFATGGLLGASGIVFMMILLSSYTTIDRSQIPLTFVLVCLLYIGNEVYSIRTEANAGISALAHITGGICGSLFGFLTVPGKKKKPAKAAPKTKTPSEQDVPKGPDY